MLACIWTSQEPLMPPFIDHGSRRLGRYPEGLMNILQDLSPGGGLGFSQSLRIKKLCLGQVGRRTFKFEDIIADQQHQLMVKNQVLSNKQLYLYFYTSTSTF